MIGGESEQIPDWIIFWGHFHPMLVHLPIGMFIMGCILYVFSKKEETQRQHQIVPILWSTGITGIISCTMGWGLSQTGEYEENTLFLHQWLGISVTISSLALAYMAKHWSKDSLMRRFFKPLFFLSFLLLLVTGHLGGNMTHGSDYLSTYLPQPWRSWIGIAPKEKRTNEVGAKIIKIKNLKEALVYQDLILPTLEQKCWSCHNAEKQKGKLRMDSPENLLKGGANGPVFLAGNPLESEMIKRVLLEASHEDHMPPKGKISLTEDEIKLLQWWVKEGAHFNKKIAEIPQDNQIKNILSRYTDGNKNSEKYVSPVLLGDIPAASESDIEKLRKHQLVVITLSSEKPFLEINAINAPKIGDKELRDIEGVKNQVVSLKLGNTQLTDAFLDQISNYPRIIQLQLDHTRISDKGIEYLGTMPHLETINLVGTSASDVGMKALSKIKTFRKVYLWQTKVSEKGIKDLQKSLPKLMIDQGWEGKWPIDTLKFPIKKPE